MFVDAGYILVEPNVRGSSGYGRKWLDADNGPKRLDVIGDIEDASRYVKAQYARNGKAPQGRRHGRQLRRLRDARRDDDVRGRVRRRRVERRHQQPRVVPAQHGAVSARAAHLGVRRSRIAMPRRCASCRP